MMGADLQRLATLRASYEDWLARHLFTADAMQLRTRILDVQQEPVRETVESAGADLANRDEVASFDARFEILFNRDAIGDLFNPLLAVGEKLAALTGGIVYESDNDAFQ
jgi:hypothetical protein